MPLSISEIREDDVRSRKLHEAFKTLLIVATPVEQESVLAVMESIPSDDTILKLHVRDLTYYLGVLGSYPIILVRSTMMGSVARDASLATVSAAATYWDLKIVIMPGIAFGADPTKQKIGDILVSSALALYESAKIDETHGVQARGGSVLSSTTLANRFTQTDKWQTPQNLYATIHFGPILSGEKLVNDPAFKQQLLKICPNAIGGEMEGAGVFAACDRRKIDWILCKSICDWGDGKKNDEWQKTAAANSANFVKSILTQQTPLESLGVTDVASIFGEKPHYHNIRGFEIIQLIHPKHQIKAYPVVSITRDKIYYEFFTVPITSTVTIGYLFFAKNINQDAAIAHFLTNQPQTFSSLTICTPRVQSAASGKDDFRVRNLKNKFLATEQFQAKAAAEFFYTEDFVWDKCFEQERPKQEFNIPDEKYFIDQEIIPLGGEQASSPKKSLKYFSEILQASRAAKPIVVILGGAGVGKTTLCDQFVRLVSRTPKKRTLYISSSDIDTGVGKEVRSISDLYALSIGRSEKAEAAFIEAEMLDVNISCGNLVVVIDGIDEIEGKLKEDFVFEDFIQDAVDLNQSFNNCTVIVTCRDYYREKYQEIDCAELLSLRGFDGPLAQDYFQKRCPDRISVATRYLESIASSFGGFYPPVVLSLICDMVELDNGQKLNSGGSTLYESKYLNVDSQGSPIDVLLIKILQREIERQSLNMQVDDIFDVLVEIAKGDRERIAKIDLSNLLKIYDGTRANDFSSFFVNPLLRSSPSDGYVGFRYDNLGLIVKARFFCYQACNKFGDHAFTQTVLNQFYDGKGELLVEILRHRPKDMDAVRASVSTLIGQLRYEMIEFEAERNRKRIESCKKQISAALHFVIGCNKSASRTDRTALLLDVFKSEREVDRLFIFGEFYPLDFTKIVVKNGGFYQYGSFGRSTFPKDGANPIFLDTEFREIDAEEGLESQKGHFDKFCHMDGNLRQMMERESGNRQEILDKVRDDFRIVFSVMYRNRMFVKKSDNIFKMKRRNVYYKITIADYLKHFVHSGVLTKEDSIGTNSDFHYEIAEAYRDEVRYFMDNNAFRRGLDSVFVQFLKDYLQIII